MKDQINKMPDSNKCDLCAHKRVFIETNATEAKEINRIFRELRQLSDADQIPVRFNRFISANIGGNVPDDHSICAISSASFHADRRCNDFIFKGLISPQDAIALHTARSTDRLTREMRELTKNLHNMTIVILLLTGLTFFLSLTAE
ncbi:hypothetical protein U5801_04955 [Lamprobacter modestohalophilus]|uniref:hypothetical protein n=1 Tax=Lamprobacter modestohalophilus TaxID=1064514 RepID=UPI002ADEBE5E|nr:hypothetical protein [Lamprobacter modestohalophilus]MEA1049158.1 hypothetical protein [Lamprobacter modestohalophilus]